MMYMFKEILVEPEPINIPNSPIVNQPAEPHVNIPFRISQQIRRPAYQMIMFIIMRVIFIGQSNNPNSFNGAISCSNDDN